MWPQSSFTGRLLTMAPWFHALLVLLLVLLLSKGSWQMTQSRLSAGMVLSLMLGAVRRNSNWAVVFFRSRIVFEEMGMVGGVLFTGQE